MVQVDLATLNSEPDSEIENFNFHGCTGGVSAFRGRPPWEFHGAGDELLFILAGQSQLTVIEDGSSIVRAPFRPVSSAWFRRGTGIPTTLRRE
jgi:hypothetical protein